jgi:replicative DNA helicase
MATQAAGFDRIPPQNLEAEVSVLGAVLQEPGALLKAMELLRPPDFYKEAHRKIFDVCLNLFERSEAVDLVTVANELLRRKQLEEVGGAAGLAALVDAVPTAANIAHHARIVKDKAVHVTGVPTGYRKFDEMTAGLQPSDLIVVAGRPSMGKTSFCLNIAEYAAIRERITVGIFSLEMSKEQLVQRLLCSLAKVNSNRLRTGYLSDADWPRLTTQAGILSESPIFIDDTPGISLLEMRAKARRLKAEQGLGLLIIDYLQLIAGRGRVENRQQEISVIALSQLSRAVESRDDKRPQLSDLRESGAIEQDADVVAFLYRPSVYKKREDPEEPEDNTTEVIIGKQRNGPTGTVYLAFLREYTRFEEQERQRDDF